MHVQYIARFSQPRAFHGFGNVPMDQTSTDAAYLIDYLMEDPAVRANDSLPDTMNDATYRQQVCQRAIDIINLPPCASSMTQSDGTCRIVESGQATQAAMKAAVTAWCQQQGATVSQGTATAGGLSTGALIGIGAVGILAVVLLLK